MKLLLNKPEPADTILVTTQVDVDGDIVIRYDGIDVMLISQHGGVFSTYDVTSRDRERLKAKGVNFSGSNVLTR